MKITTQGVLGAAALAGLVAYSWSVLPPVAAIVATAAATWEAWAIYRGLLTISEVVWRASDYTDLVPAGGGAALGWAIGSGTVTEPGVIAPLALLAGHFWFPRVSTATRAAIGARRETLRLAEAIRLRTAARRRGGTGRSRPAPTPGPGGP